VSQTSRSTVAATGGWNQQRDGTFGHAAFRASSRRLLPRRQFCAPPSDFPPNPLDNPARPATAGRWEDLSNIIVDKSL